MYGGHFWRFRRLWCGFFLEVAREQKIPTSSCQKGQIQIGSLANFGDTDISSSINWFKIALRIGLQFDFWHEIVFWWTYGSFVVHLWPLVLSIKASMRVFTTKVYVGIKNTLHWQNLMDRGHLTRKVPRWKLAKPRTHQPWRPPSSHSCHGALLLTPPHETISLDIARKDCVIKTKKYYNYYSLFNRLVATCGDLWVFVLVELTYHHKTRRSPFWMPWRLRTPNRT